MKKNNRRGIIAGGNWIIDQVKIIDKFPEEEKLVNIISEYKSNGGAAFNVLKDLFKLEVPFPIEAIGLLGEDEHGMQILKECKQMGINARLLLTTNQSGTSYTDVMSVESTGRRTFFHHRGANALLDESMFDFSVSNSKLFHLGYLLLLDKMDVINEMGETGAARVLKNAKENGLITSVDIVSESSARFSDVIPASLPYVDYLFINEFEAQMLTGISTTINGAVSIEQCIEAASSILKMGVQKWVILHFPEGVTAISQRGEMLHQTSLNIPSSIVAGSVGAGDAFAAGVLTGIHEEWNMKKCLEFGVSVAASSLTAPTCSDGVKSFSECLSMMEKYGFKQY